MSNLYLSNSTQTKNIGVNNYGTEAAYCASLCDLYIAPYLRKYGVMVMRNSQNMDYVAIKNDSNSKQPQIHVSVHTNANTGVSRGCEVYCYKFGGEGEKIARAVYKRLEAITPTADRGVQTANFTEVAETNCPAILIEIAFHDNVEDVKWLIEKKALIGQEIARGLLEYFGIAQQEFVYADDSQISEYAKDSVYWARSMEYLVGYNGNFKPHDPVTREELAVILHRVYGGRKV